MCARMCVVVVRVHRVCVCVCLCVRVCVVVWFVGYVCCVVVRLGVVGVPCDIVLVWCVVAWRGVERAWGCGACGARCGAARTVCMVWCGVVWC